MWHGGAGGVLMWVRVGVRGVGFAYGGRMARVMTDRRLRAAFEEALVALMTTPRPPGSLKMAGYTDHWRIRVGEWRVVYRTLDGRLVALVVTVAPRSGVYR